MSNLSNKTTLFPKTSEIKDKSMQEYAKKLTRALEEMKKQILKEVKVYIDQQIDAL